ncbi:MAG: glyoxylase-like metal-dependent hydrolase (beta-lactamase superfamily II) [Myxococcota bacterium]|jgi:glyoxylase-like metal-dependent hydrolase (beta-lactamase superfamily II)
MNRRLLLFILAALGLTGLMLAVPGLALYRAFSGNIPLEDGRTFAAGRVTTVVDGYVACFLVDVGEGRFLLIDACQDSSVVRAALAAHDATPADLEAVFLTHSHIDHVAGLAGLPDVPVRALRAELPTLHGEAAHLGPLPAMMGIHDAGVRVTEPLEDGDRVRVGDATVEVFGVPGHTAGSAVYLVHGVLLVGDSSGMKTTGNMVGAPWVFSDDTEQNAASMRALAARLADRSDGIEAVVPAHTGPADGLTALSDL